MTPTGVNTLTVASARRFWVYAHGCSPDALDGGGILVTRAPPALPPSLVLVLHWGAATVVAGPEQLLPRLRGLAESAGTAGVEDTLVAGLGELVHRVVGPTSLAFADETSLRAPAPVPGIVTIPIEVDDPRLLVLARSCGELAWEHAGIGEGVSAFAAVDEEGCVRSVAGYSVLGDTLAHVGVLTEPAHRGRGLAAVSGYAAASYAVAAGLVAQWQTLVANASSLAVGRRLGFFELGRRLTIRLAAQPNATR